MEQKKHKMKIANVITLWLVAVVAVACVITSLLICSSMARKYGEDAEELVRQNVEDVTNDINNLMKEEYDTEILKQIGDAATNRRIGNGGYVLICDTDHNIINSYNDTYTGKTTDEAGISIERGKNYSYETDKRNVFGTYSFVNINETLGIYVIGVYPVKESVEGVYTTMNTAVALEIVVFGLMFLLLLYLLHKLVINNMVKVNESLVKIREGNLDERVEVRDTYEFDNLSTGINDTVDRLKKSIDAAESRMNAELAIAKEIQTSALPRIFPPFPARMEFELFASMEAAKEVGGDFYDFYMINGEQLAFLIADVSGKSVPGAMFMMKAKGVIRSLADSGLPPAGIFTVANEELCEDNEAEMFLTAWMGFLEPETGVLNVANAGHNPPVLIRDGKAEFFKVKPGLMLAGMPDKIYKQHELKLEVGDILFLYTDGVTEAIDKDENQYGEKRLLELLSFGDNYPEPSGLNGVAGAVCELVSADVAKFVNGAEQSDDITMLCIRYLGGFGV